MFCFKQRAGCETKQMLWQQVKIESGNNVMEAFHWFLVILLGFLLRNPNLNQPETVSRWSSAGLLAVQAALTFQLEVIYIINGFISQTKGWL